MCVCVCVCVCMCVCVCCGGFTSPSFAGSGKPTLASHLALLGKFPLVTVRMNVFVFFLAPSLIVGHTSAQIVTASPPLLD